MWVGSKFDPSLACARAGMGFKQFAFLRAAWTLDSLTEDVREIFKKSGTKGLLEPKGIGKKMSDEIINLLETRASGLNAL